MARGNRQFVSVFSLQAYGLLVWITLGSALIAVAGDPETEFDELFGKEIRRVMATPGAEDDLELARTLLLAARKISGESAILGVLCDRAHDLAVRHPDGQGTAVEALRLMTDGLPALRTASLDRLIALHQKQFTRGGPHREDNGEALIEVLLERADLHDLDEPLEQQLSYYRRAHAVASAIRSERAEEIKRLSDRATELGRLTLQIQTLKAKLQSDQHNRDHARELVRIYLIELDEPLEARKYSFLLDDQARRQQIRLACIPIEKIDGESALSLGDWYRSLETEAGSQSARTAMLARAEACYDRFIKTHATQDALGLRVTAHRQQIQTRLAELGGGDQAATSTTEANWVDLMDLIDPQRDADRGAWVLRGQVLTVEPGGNAALRLPVRLEGDYELRARLARLGDGGVMMSFPVGERSASVYLDYPQGHSSLGPIDGIPGYDRDNPARITHGGLKSQQAYHLHLKVKQDNGQTQIRVMLNGRMHTQWSGENDRIGTPRGGITTPRLMTWSCGLAVRSLEVRQSDHGQLVRMNNESR